MSQLPQLPQLPQQTEYRIINGNKNLIVAFGGKALQFGMIPPFEFLRYLSATYQDCDLVFYIDIDQCWYHKGLRGITSNVDDTATYLTSLSKNYENVTFIGTSAGGYAAILFGSLCRVDHVVAFIPQTLLKDPVDERYGDLKRHINSSTKYLLYGDASIKDVDHDHHVRHCDNLDCPGVSVTRLDGCDMRILRNNGTLKEILDGVVFKNR